MAQGFGWTWGEDRKPRDNPGFSAVYTVSLFLAAIPIMLGLDPLRLTIFSMALTAASLPMTVVPLLFLLNDAMSARIATVFSPMPRSSS
ncbi:hypothetical protein LB543_08720 [Mesorhizobium sp. ESP7-2]|uniref:hypothetical protein n=1 Tax=unclassified Mesorhizobium TaxID=325217 RepID=UPI001CC9C10E|nr:MULTISPECIES: hypothetical protein [unclassified Mesorhizobium]MBZ9706806.1 hypothetical protein [Mesorhizobium sp. ESP7-2]